MIQARHQVKRILLTIGDIAVFQAALALTLLIRYGNLEATWSSHVLPFAVITLLWIVGFYVAGLYDLALLREPFKLFRTYLEGMMANLAVAFAFFYLIPIFGIAPRTNLFLYFAVSLLLGYGWRIVFAQLIADRFSRDRVLFIGTAEEAARIYELLRSSALGLDLATVLITSGEPHPGLPVSWLKTCENFDQLLMKERITTVVLGVDPNQHPNVKTAIYQALFSPVAWLDRAEIEEVTTSRIPLSHVSEAWFLQHIRETHKAWYETLKRGVDVLLSIPFLLVTCALFPFIALLIKISSPGPTLYSQLRVGRGGVPFRIWKFRTMKLDAEIAGPQFTTSAKTDPRLFPVGRLLRQLRLDELPQIWNVLRGDLSLIGPRPERPEFVAPLIERIPYYALRHLTRPGLTGWAQVRFLTPTSSLDDNLKKLQYDLFYIKNRSLLLDLAILLKTVGIVLRRQGT